MNTRAVILTLIIIGLIFLICISLSALNAPRLQSIRATATIVAIVAQAQEISATQTAKANSQYQQMTQLAEDSANATNEALNAITQTAEYISTQAAIPTETPTPTVTITPTPIPVGVVCTAKITGSDRYLFPYPDSSMPERAIKIRRDSSVEIIGRLDDHGWVKARFQDNPPGWLRSDFYTQDENSCVPTEFNLHYLLEEDTTKQDILLEDTFFTNTNRWMNSQGQDMFPFVDEFGDSRLSLRSPELETANPSRLESINSFKLITSFTRADINSSSFVGFRFRSNPPNYLELRILRDCKVEVYTKDTLFFKGKVDSGTNTCNDGIDDFVNLTLDQNYLLQLIINDSDPLPVQLEDPQGIYASGGLTLLVNAADANFSYLLVTQPR